MHSFSRQHQCCAGAARGVFALPGTTRKYERSLPFRFEHVVLELHLDLPGKAVDGVATWSFERAAASATQLRLDAVAFDVSRVELDSGKGFAPARFEYDGLELVIEVLARVKSGRVRIAYRAKPERGLYFLAPDETTPTRPLQVWSQCQDEDARHWFPCHDKPHVKTTAEFIVHAPKEFDVLCNGELVSDGVKKRQRAVHYAMRQKLPSYLFTLVVGQFERVVDRPAKLESGREIPVEYWVPAGKRADALRAFGQTPRMLELFSRLTGVDYPYPRYTQVVVSEFIFGGMENTTATTLYEHVLLDERAAIDIESHDLVAHELAHQWFGDFVTCRDWPQAWLNEGFASYMESIEREDRLGVDDYFWGIERDQSAYLSEAGGRYHRAVVAREYEDPINLFDRHLYEKGALVLHLLRTELGAETFWAGVRSYLESNSFGSVSTVDLQRALEQVSARSLDRFFDQWLHRPGHPAIKARVAYEDHRAVVRFEQHQAELFELTFEIEVRDAQGKLHHASVTSSDKHVTVSVPLKERPNYIAVDPKLRLVGSLQWETAFDFAAHQLKHGSAARLRRQAATWLGTRHDFRAVALLAAALGKKGEHASVRVAAASALGKLRTEDAFQALLDAITVEEPRARAAVAVALGEFRTAASAKRLAAALKGERSYLVEAALTRALGMTRQASNLKVLSNQARRRSWADVVAAAALEGLALLASEEALEVVLAQSQPGVPTRARSAAAAALGRLAEFAPAKRRLMELLSEPEQPLRTDVAIALGNIGDGKARAALESRLAEERDGRVIRRIREALRRIESGEDQRALRDQVQRLERELDDVKARLSVLSHKKG